MSDSTARQSSTNTDLPEINTAEGRTYIHKQCGTATNVTGSDLTSVCNPFQLVMGTICANCATPSATWNFEWEDTGENVSTYRRRGVMQMPLLAILSWLVLPAIGGGIGGLIGSNIKGAFGPMTDLGIGLGVLSILVFLGPMIVNAVASQRILNRDRRT